MSAVWRGVKFGIVAAGSITLVIVGVGVLLLHVLQRPGVMTTTILGYGIARAMSGIPVLVLCGAVIGGTIAGVSSLLRGRRPSQLPSK